MGSSPSLSARETRSLSDSTGFSSEQIEILHRRFLYLSDGRPTMSKSSFDSIQDLANNPIKSRIVNAFFDGRNLGLPSKSVDEITFENFLTTLSYFQHMDENHPEEDLEQCKTKKLKYVEDTQIVGMVPNLDSQQTWNKHRTFQHVLFHMYDTDRDGKITLEELREIVEELLSKKRSTEKTSTSIADAAMLEAANICKGHTEPTEPYEEINLQDFLQIMQDLKIESKMHVRFLQLDTTAMCR